MAQPFLSLLPQSLRELQAPECHLSFRHILCSVDSLDSGVHAIQYADSIAARFSARLTLLHSAPLGELKLAMSRPAAASSLGYGHGRNRIIRFALESYPGQGVADEIVSLARSEKYDLIVMPAPRGAIRRWLPAGSAAARVMRAVKCPVIAGSDFNGLARQPAAGGVVCAIDLGPRSARVLRFAAALAREWNVPNTVVHVADLENPAEEFFGANGELTAKGRLMERVLHLQEETGALGDAVVEAGPLPEVVARTAGRFESQLVVIGRSIRRRLFGKLRANTPAILRSAPCPVICV